jgi:ribosomal protein L37AE/L43A
MCPVANWEEKREAYSNLNWRELGPTIYMTPFIRMRYLPPGEDVRIQVILRNENAPPIASKIYVGPDTHKINECYSDKVDAIEPGTVWWNVYNIPMKNRKNKKLGEHQMGVFVELKTATAKAGTAARVAVGLLTGIKLSKKIQGMSTKFKVVDSIPCPACKKPMKFGRDQVGTPYWSCADCNKQYFN